MSASHSIFSKACCTKCGKLKDLSEFHCNRKTSNGHQPRCKTCIASWAKLHRQRKKEDGSAHAYYLSRKRRLKAALLPKKFGITIEQFDTMLKAQCGGCAICGRMSNGKGCKGTPKDLAVDHNHKTGKVRALLCTRCNRLVGYIEQPGLLEKAVRYLAAHEAQEE